MPTRRRRSVSSISRAKMSSPFSRTSPSMRTPGTRSFMRFRVFKKVDFPQPEGPISAVISRSPTSSEMLFSALKSPYQRFRSFADITGTFVFSIEYLIFYRTIAFFQHPRPLRHCLRNATSPKVRGLGSPCKVSGFARGSPFGRAVETRSAETERARPFTKYPAAPACRFCEPTRLL